MNTLQKLFTKEGRKQEKDSKVIDLYLKNENRVIANILLVGLSFHKLAIQFQGRPNTGARTWIKQLSRLHDNGFNPEEESRQLLCEAVITQIQNILYFMKYSNCAIPYAVWPGSKCFLLKGNWC